METVGNLWERASGLTVLDPGLYVMEKLNLVTMTNELA